MADVGRVVVDADHLVLAVDLEMGIEAGDGIDAGFELADKIAIVEDGRHEEPALAQRRVENLLRHAEQVAHRREVVAGKSDQDGIGRGLGVLIRSDRFLQAGGVFRRAPDRVPEIDFDGLGGRRFPDLRALSA